MYRRVWHRESVIFTPERLSTCGAVPGAMDEQNNDNWITPQALALELGINASVVYGWIQEGTIQKRELGQGHNTGKKRYLVDRTTRPPLRDRGRPA